MDFKIEAKVEIKEPNTITVGVCVPPSLFDDIKRIKDSNKKNRELFNEYTRKFFAQLIEKFDNGEFNKSA